MWLVHCDKVLCKKRWLLDGFWGVLPYVYFGSTIDLKMARFTTKITGVVVVEVGVMRTFRWRLPAVVVLSV